MVSLLSGSCALTETRTAALPRFSMLTVWSATPKLCEVCGVTVADTSAKGRMVRLPAAWARTAGSALEEAMTTKGPVPAAGLDARGGRNSTRASPLVLGISRIEGGSTEHHDGSAPET